jgi:glycosyltransferase involved in cell wall biosynthesis
MASCWQDGMIVLCAANGYDEPGMTDWHMARHLSRLVPVLYVDPPVSRLRQRRRPGTPRLRMVSASLARLTPAVLPFPSRPGMTGITSGLLRRYLRRATARLGGNVRAVITAWPHFSVLGACGEDVSVYWAQDDYAGGAELLGLDPAMLEHRERTTATASQLVVAVSPVLHDAWASRGHDVVLIPNGADTEALQAVDAAPVPADVRLPAPVAGFTGRLNGRTDLALLEAITERLRSLLLVGPASPELAASRRFRALCARGNVQWTGRRPASAIPGYLRLTDVGLVPYADSSFNRGSFPIKTLEYLAAGRPVVSTPLPATRWLNTDLITIADGPEEFAGAVDKALSRPRTPELVRARQAFAAGHSWPRRAADLHAAIVRRGQRA